MVIWKGEGGVTGWWGECGGGEGEGKGQERGVVIKKRKIRQKGRRESVKREICLQALH